MFSDLVCSGSSNKILQTGWLITIKNHFVQLKKKKNKNKSVNTHSQSYIFKFNKNMILTEIYKLKSFEKGWGDEDEIVCLIFIFKDSKSLEALAS